MVGKVCFCYCECVFLLLGMGCVCSCERALCHEEHHHPGHAPYHPIYILAHPEHRPLILSVGKGAAKLCAALAVVGGGFLSKQCSCCTIQLALATSVARTRYYTHLVVGEASLATDR